MRKQLENYNPDYLSYYNRLTSSMGASEFTIIIKTVSGIAAFKREQHNKDTLTLLLIYGRILELMNEDDLGTEQHTDAISTLKELLVGRMHSYQ